MLDNQPTKHTLNSATQGSEYMALSVFMSNPGWGDGLEGEILSKLYVYVPAGSKKLNFLYTNFSHHHLPISIPFLKEKHPILLKLSIFTIIC